MVEHDIYSFKSYVTCLILVNIISHLKIMINYSNMA